MIPIGPLLRCEPPQVAEYHTRGHLYLLEKPVVFWRHQNVNPEPPTFEADALPLG